MCLCFIFCNLKSFNFFPTDNCAAIFANGILLYLLTKGTVRLERGFTSNTYTISSLTANCKLISPTTFNVLANLVVTSIISFLTLLLILCAGKTQEESPE